MSGKWVLISESKWEKYDHEKHVSVMHAHVALLDGEWSYYLFRGDRVLNLTLQKYGFATAQHAKRAASRMQTEITREHAEAIHG